MTQHNATSVNIVHLGGWLTLESVRTLSLNGHGDPLSILGWIHTRKPHTVDMPPLDTSYPVLLTGVPASLVLEWSRESPAYPLRVLIRGRLFRRNGQCLVKVRFVERLAPAMTLPHELQDTPLPVR